MESKKWSQHVGYMVQAYYSTRCDATGHYPFILMFGREASCGCLLRNSLDGFKELIILSMWIN
jgi:hypothetical protein